MRCRQYLNAWGRRYGAVSDWPDDDATWQRIAAGHLEPCDDDWGWLNDAVPSEIVPDDPVALTEPMAADG